MKIVQIRTKRTFFVFRFSFLFLFILLLFNLSGQTLVEGKLLVNTLTEQARPGSGKIVQNAELLKLFEQFGVTKFEKAFPFAKTPSLHAVYTVEFTGNHYQFVTDLEYYWSSHINGILEEYEPISNYEPEDEFWEEGKLWHLEKIQADSAWDYTRSSDSIDIAIIESSNKLSNHPDLLSKFDPVTDYFSGEQIFFDMPTTATIQAKHATGVSSFAACETTEVGITPQGRLASSGFNSSMMITSVSSQLTKAVFASTVLNVEVINISSYAYGCHDFNQEYPSYIYDAFDEIFNNGTVIVASAGNNVASCYHTPYAIFNGYIDSRIIQVSSTDRTDSHTVYDEFGSSSTHSHFSAVDLCAPGYNMWGPDMNIIIDPGTGDTSVNTYPYYQNWSGTSFSAPITAGVAALIKSINPCLTPEDVQTILKTTTDPIIDANLYPGKVGTGRLNAYKAVKLAYDSYSFKNYTISSGQNITWNDSKFIDTLYIAPGGELTINDDCFFNYRGIVQVDTNAKLTINDAILTTTCGNMWNGIEVWGNYYQSQYPYYSGDYAQGRLFLDGATIENAEEAVRLWKYGNYTSSGGICVAQNATFYNNRRSVEFIKYQNTFPPTGTPDLNLSTFENCQFIYDDQYLKTVPFVGFVSLWDVEGIDFIGCDFINERDSIYYNDHLVDDSIQGYGIYSLDAHYIVSSGCNSLTSPCPQNDIDSSRFEKLRYGIEAVAVSSNNTIAVDETVFIDNITGLYTSGLQSARIIHNTFFINAVDTLANDGAIGGVYFDNYSTGFVFEENNLFSNQGIIGGPWGGGNIKSVGITVNNSGVAENRLYNNHFEGLFVGVLAQNFNRGRLDGSTGLQILCNEFYNIEYDIAVTCDSLHNPYNTLSGIRHHQGSNGTDATNPAGNLFSENMIPEDGWDIYTETYDKIIKYWYHHNTNGYDVIPDSVSQFLVQVTYDIFNNVAYARSGACPPNFNNGGGTGILLSLVNENNQKADSINTLLSSLVDGGDTDGTTYDVQTAFPDETLEVRADLLNKSPYLSDTVMVATVQQDEVLPAAIVTEVLIANPQSANSDAVLDEVYARDDISNNQIDQIEANAIVTGAKESLEIKKALYLGNRDYALNLLLSAYKSDTSITKRIDSVEYVLKDQDYALAKYKLAFEYLDRDELQMAQDTIESLPSRFIMTDDELTEHYLYEDYMDILVNLKQNNKTIFELSENQKASLHSLRCSSFGPVAGWSTALLKNVGDLVYNESYILPTEGNKQGIVRRQRSFDNIDQNILKVYPNPARDYIIIEYQFTEDVVDVKINVTNSNGTILQTIVPENNIDFAVINTSHLKNGSYFCTVNINGKQHGVAKFVVLH